MYALCIRTGYGSAWEGRKKSASLSVNAEYKLHRLINIGEKRENCVWRPVCIKVNPDVGVYRFLCMCFSNRLDTIKYYVVMLQIAFCYSIHQLCQHMPSHAARCRCCQVRYNGLRRKMASNDFGCWACVQYRRCRPSSFVVHGIDDRKTKDVYRRYLCYTLHRVLHSCGDAECV